MNVAGFFDQINFVHLLPPYPDPRAAGYPLMSSYSPTVLITLAYVIGVCTWRSELVKRSGGQKVVRSSAARREHAEKWGVVRALMVLYNFLMVCYSSYLFFAGIIAVRRVGYGLGCAELPDPNDPKTDVLLYLGYLFFFSKFVEMLDTVFFLLRGKVDQVTFLHVFHHAAMPPSMWWGLKYAPGGIVYTFLLFNSFVHMVMYTYYGMAAAGLYKYLWWKNYLTQLQMLQFVLLILHQGQIFVRSTPCNYPKVFPAAIVMYASIFLVLFGNFYVKAYWRKQRLVKLRVHKMKTEVILDDSDCVGKAVGKLSNGHVPNGICTRSTEEADVTKRR